MSISLSSSIYIFFQYASQWQWQCWPTRPNRFQNSLFCLLPSLVLVLKFGSFEHSLVSSFITGHSMICMLDMRDQWIFARRQLGKVRSIDQIYLSNFSSGLFWHPKQLLYYIILCYWLVDWDEVVNCGFSLGSCSCSRDEAPKCWNWLLAFTTHKSAYKPYVVLLHPTLIHSLILCWWCARGILSELRTNPVVDGYRW